MATASWIPMFLLVGGVCFFFFLLFWVVRAAVSSGIEDAARRERERQH
ncbi:hypothetical protein [Catellatospora sichuanensis]|nr:hypothetical protein [Catellatospora sichuanensis]